MFLIFLDFSFGIVFMSSYGFPSSLRFGAAAFQISLKFYHIRGLSMKYSLQNFIFLGYLDFRIPFKDLGFVSKILDWNWVSSS